MKLRKVLSSILAMTMMLTVPICANAATTPSNVTKSTVATTIPAISTISARTIGRSVTVSWRGAPDNFTGVSISSATYSKRLFCDGSTGPTAENPQNPHFVPDGSLTFDNLPVGTYTATLIKMTNGGSYICNTTFTIISLDKTTCTRGENINVSFAGAKSAKDWICINEDPNAAGESLIWEYLNGSTVSPSTVQGDGSITINTTNLAPGTYYVHYSTGDSYSQDGSTYFTVTGEEPTMTLDKTTYKQGEKINVNFTGAANTTDWIGINKKASAAGYSILWYYLNGSTTAPTSVIQNGSITIDTSTLAPGTYYIYYCKHDKYDYYAKTSFTVI